MRNIYKEEKKNKRTDYIGEKFDQQKPKGEGKYGRSKVGGIKGRRSPEIRGCGCVRMFERAINLIVAIHDSMWTIS